MNCPKCGSPLRASKQKEGYFLCDTCRTRMSLEYINKISVPKSEAVSEPTTATTSINTQLPKKKKFPVFLIIILLLLGCIFIFFHFKLYEKIKATFSPAETSVSLTESIDFCILDYEVVSENIVPAPAYLHKFLLVNVQISNHSSDDLSVDSMSNFETYVDNSKLSYCSNSEDVLTSLGYTSLNNELPSGESITGYLCFELPDSWNILEIHYAPTIWSPTEIILEIKNTD